MAESPVMGTGGPQWPTSDDAANYQECRRPRWTHRPHFWDKNKAIELLMRRRALPEQGQARAHVPAARRDHRPGPNGIKALVLELVEGPTLADRIAQGDSGRLFHNELRKRS